MAGRLNPGWFRGIWILSVIGAALAVLFSIYLPNYGKLKKLREANEKILRDIEKLEDEIALLKEKNELIDIDQYILENIARQQIGFIRENEIVVDIKR